MAFKIRSSYLDSVAPAPSAPRQSRGAGLSKGGGKYAAVTRAAISTGTAGAFGFLEGKGLLPTLVAGQPWLGVDLLTGAAIHAALMFAPAKYVGKAAPYLAPVADGALANWGSYMGLWLAKGGGVAKVYNGGVRGEMGVGAPAAHDVSAQYANTF